MSEDCDVSQIGENWNSIVHRKAVISRCANGYIVEYDIRSQEKNSGFFQVVRERRVFITNSDLLEFVEEYFTGEPKP